MGTHDLKPDKAGLVPVICFHSWLPVDKETNIEECRHCGLSYELIEGWKRGAPGKGRQLDTEKRKVHGGDPKKANIHRPPECGDGDGHPLPIAWVPEEKAIEWGVWPLPAPQKGNKKDAPKIPNREIIQNGNNSSHIPQPEKEDPPMTEKETSSEEMSIPIPPETRPKPPPSNDIKGRKAFIKKYKERILIELKVMKVNEVAKLWGISYTSVLDIDNESKGLPRKYVKKPAANAVKEAKQRAENARADMSGKNPDPMPKPLAPPSAPAKEKHIMWAKSYKLKTPGAAVTLRVEGNMMGFSRFDADFVLSIRDRLANYDKEREAAEKPRNEATT